MLTYDNLYFNLGRAFHLQCQIYGHKHANKKTFFFMNYERFRRYSHLPHQVANNNINCYYTKLSKYQNLGTQVC